MDHLLQFIGRLHPLIVHVPIDVIMLAIGLHAFTWRSSWARFREILPLLWFISCISAVFASLAGYLLSLSGDYAEETLATHMWLGLGLAVLSGFIFILISRKASPKFLNAGVVLAALLLFSAGHYGGNLTHGEEYLTQPLYAFIGNTPQNQTPKKPITNIQEAVVFEDLITPILEQKCYQCHGATKQKGKLRLDSEEFLSKGGKGGKHGKVLVPGQADKSDLYARLILPEENDKRMPPKGKTQLTQNEVNLIYWWITQGGGDFKKKVAEVKKDENITKILVSLGTGTPEELVNSNLVANAEIPRIKVAKPKPALLKNLENLGVAITPLTPDHTLFSANLVNVQNFSDEQVDLLLQLKDQMLWLDMSGTRITDKALTKIAQLKNLTRLSLDNTAVTDAGILHLKSLPALRYLNLYGTNVTDISLKNLEAFQNLKVLYLWQTQVTAEGVAALQKARGTQLEINFGSEFESTANL